MGWCAVEDPIQRNEQLYVLDDVSHEIVLSTFTIPAMKRYCFLFERDETERCAASLQRIMLRQSDVQLFAVHAWRSKLAGVSPLRTRIKRRRLEKNGWITGEGKAIGYALRNVTVDFADIWKRSSRRFLVVGADQLNIADIQNETMLAVLEKVADGRPMLSASVIVLSQQNGWTMMYRRADDSGRVGIVLVTAESLDLGALREAGLADRVYFDTEAMLLWRRGPAGVDEDFRDSGGKN